jgi:iron complex outermembrane receptor protein
MIGTGATMITIHRHFASGTLCLVLGSTGVSAANAVGNTDDRLTALDLKKLSIDDLMGLEVTSVSKQAERLADAPSSIFVITSDDIRRAGVTSLEEALRLAPNLQVARIDASQYAISARGFNNAVGNKLLVLIDGRTVYTPIFSGVFWDQQDVMLEDVERIEVISGPGATLWGANAVNGVINVISRKASDTQGGLVSLRGGDEETGATLRYGGALGDNTHVRVYAKGAQLDNTRRANGTAVPDAFDFGQVGFRADWQSGRDELTVHGDVYSGHAEDRGSPNFGPVGRIKSSGANLLSRWTRTLENSDLRVQAYVDHAERQDLNTFSPEADVYDLELQHSVRRGNHRLVWGGGYRHGRDEVEPGRFLGLIPSGFIPASQALDWWNVFAQADFALTDSFSLTAGLKFEHNDYTGVENLPSVRFAWKLSPQLSLWGAASRAVRAPSRLDRDLFLPLTPPFIFAGGPDFVSEVAHVYETGLRGQVSNRVTYSATLFWHDWDKLRSGSAPQVVLQNQINGSVYGLEAWGTWEVIEGWRLSAGLLSLHKDLTLEPASTDPGGVDNPNLSNDPDYKMMLRASVDLGSDHQLDLSARHVATLPHPVVPNYTAVDLRYAWRARPELEVSLVLRNAFGGEHAQFNDAPARSQIASDFYGQVRWSF